MGGVVEADRVEDSLDGSLFQSFKKASLYALLTLVVIVGGIIVMATLVAPAEAPDAKLSPEQVAARIAKVGSVTMVDLTPHEARTGEQVFNAQCAGCHASGALNAPKFGDKAAWGPRVAKGFEALWTSALHGKNSMPAQGGGQFSDFEVARGVVYMANAGGAKFAEPKEGAKPAK